MVKKEIRTELREVEVPVIVIELSVEEAEQLQNILALDRRLFTLYTDLTDLLGL